jgi:hypothetical protein
MAQKASPSFRIFEGCPELLVLELLLQEEI